MRRNLLAAVTLAGLVLPLRSGLAGGPLEATTACEHGICFAFPSPDPSLFFAPSPDGPGPFLMDHFASAQVVERERVLLCRNYLGQGFDGCYPGHHGSDFMLKGGFRAMTQNIPVTAAARGEVIAADDSHYDKCHGSLIDLLKGGDGISCGIDPETGQPRPQTANYVRIRHWNGRYYVYSKYLHFKQGSIPAWIKDALTRGEYPQIECGDLIGYVGSAGDSAAPHIHLEVRYKADDVDGEYLDTDAIDPYCGPYTPDRTWSMWTFLESSDALPAAACQDPYDPFAENAPTAGMCLESSALVGRPPPASRPRP